MDLKGKILSLLEQQLPPEVEVVDVILNKAMGQLHIQVLLDRESGVDLDFLTRHNRIIGDLLDARDIPGPYLLEVSSAGLERSLVRPANYMRFSGRKVNLSLKEPINNIKTLTGTLAGYSEDDQLITITSEGLEFEVALANVDRAHLVFEF